MLENWLIVTSPLLLIGIPLLLFGDRNISHHRDNMQNGKEFIWQEHFRPGLGELVTELDESVQFGDKIAQMKAQFESDEEPNPEGVSSKDEIIMELCMNAPFTPALRDATDSISSHSRDMGQLEEDYNKLPDHLRKMGGFMIISWVFLLFGVIQHETVTFQFLVYTAGAALFVIASFWEAKKYLTRKDRLRKYADKYEKSREI